MGESEKRGNKQKIYITEKKKKFNRKKIMKNITWSSGYNPPGIILRVKNPPAKKSSGVVVTTPGS